MQTDSDPTADPRAYVRRLLHAQEVERQFLARRLHDHFGQVLTAAVLELEFVQTAEAPSAVLTEVVATLRQLLADLRDLTLSLRPALLDEEGIAVALQVFLDRFSSISGIAARVRVSHPVPRMPAEVEITLFRIVQEFATQLARPLHARALVVELAVDGGLVANMQLEGVPVQDPDLGLVPKVGDALRTHVQWLRGNCRWQSQGPQQVAFTVEIPLD